MNRRRFLRLCGKLLTALGLAHLFPAHKAAAAAAIRAPRQIVTEDIARARTIMWDAPSLPARALVEVRHGDSVRQIHAAYEWLSLSGEALYHYAASVTGLTPETPYYARVRATGGEWSTVVSATTTGGAVPTPGPEPITGVCSPTNGAGISMQIASTHGVTYELQYTTNLNAQPPVWVRAISCEGTGAGITLQDPDSLGVQRFYRIVKP